MATHKRKTLQIKRPEPTAYKPGEKKPLPQVNVNENAATGAVDTDQIGVVGPKTARLRQPDPNKYPEDVRKGQTTRIALPDEETLRRARRADDVGMEEDALPKAEQVETAQKSATMPIMIDTEEVRSSAQRLPTGDTGDAGDQTMQIDAEALATGNVEPVKGGADQTMPIEVGGQTVENDSLPRSPLVDVGSDRTMKIDADALQTGDIGKVLADADAGVDEGSDRTMRIDASALQTGDIGKVLADADAGVDEGSDRTMKIDAEALATGRIDKVLPEEIMAQETMKMEAIPESLIPKPAAKDKEAFNASTVAIPQPEEGKGEAKEEAFNAMTMAMDAEELAKELAKGDTRKQDDPNLDQTMDLTAERPKTILIKRPSREAAAAPMAPTVKTARPDAVTVRTSRPVTAQPSTPKEGTSRVDVPEGVSTTTEGKTIKLRRPGGAPTSRPGAPISRVTAGAGLHMNADGTVRSTLRAAPAFGGGTLAMAIITLLVAASAIWVVYSIKEVGLPMPGRLVDANRQLVVQ